MQSTRVFLTLFQQRSVIGKNKINWRIDLMKKTISIMTEEFENEKTGERVEGITIMVDGVIKELFDIIKREKKEYSNNVSIVQDALMKGLEEIKNTI
jgi:hypothetical protein